MQALQPMQMDLSKSTIPSPRWCMAAVGQASAHGGSAHWLQRVTWKARRTSGKRPISAYLTYVRFTESGTWFSDLQAVLHAWQPMQRVWSMTFAHCTAGPGMRLLLHVFLERSRTDFRAVDVSGG